MERILIVPVNQTCRMSCSSASLSRNWARGRRQRVPVAFGSAPGRDAHLCLVVPPVPTLNHNLGLDSLRSVERDCSVPVDLFEEEVERTLQQLVLVRVAPARRSVVRVASHRDRVRARPPATRSEVGEPQRVRRGTPSSGRRVHHNWARAQTTCKRKARCLQLNDSPDLTLFGGRAETPPCHTTSRPRCGRTTARMSLRQTQTAARADPSRDILSHGVSGYYEKVAETCTPSITQTSAGAC